MVRIRKTKQQIPQDGPAVRGDDENPDQPVPFIAAVRRRMTINQIILVALLLCFALFMRAYKPTSPERPTGDEYHYPWVGLSILHGEAPTAWSYLGAYNTLNLHKGKIFHKKWIFMPVSPAFDHPPLFSLLAGCFVTLTGAATPVVEPLERYDPKIPLETSTKDYVGTMRIWDLDFARLRMLPVILFAWAFVMLFGVTYRAYSFTVAFWTCLFYSTIAHVIIHQRLAVTESLLAPLLLTNMYVMQSYFMGKITRRRFAVLTIILCAAAPLTKLIAIAQTAIMFYLLLLARKRRELLYPIIGAAIGVGLFFVYGMIYGLRVFLAVQMSQSARFVGFDAIENIILKPFLYQTHDFSYVLFLGWIAVFAVVFRERGNSLLAAAIVYLSVFVFFAESTGIWGWHLQVIYPFLCLGLGLLANEGWESENIASSMMIIVLLLPYVFQTFYLKDNKADAQLFRYAYLLIMAGALGGLSFAPQAVQKWGYRLTTAGLFGVVLYFEVMTVVNDLF